MISTTANNKQRTGNECDDAVVPDKEDGRENSSDDKVRGYVGYEGSFGGPSRGRGRGEYRYSRGRGRHHDSHHDSWTHNNSSNKFYERPELAVNLPEDPRISKLLRRLCAECDIEKSLVICSKLQDAVMLPENSRYIRRSYDILVESLLDVFYDAPGPETKESAAVVLGRIGYVMGPDYRKHLDWIVSTYSAHNTSIKHLLTLSFVETYQLEQQTPSLNDFADITLEHLQSVIEATDSSDVFMAAINAMIIISNSFPEHFASHFVDTVDILVGWHVDNAQPKKIKDFALKSLLRLSRHWQADVGFSINLLEQFIEDMIAYSNNLDTEYNDNEETTPEECMQKITSFLNVFNTVVKSLGSLLNPNVTQTVNWTFLTTSLTKILQVLTDIFNEHTDYELIIAGNESIILLLDYLQGKTTSCMAMMFSLVTAEVTNYINIDDNVCLSLINLISKIIKEVAANLPIEFICEIIGPESLLKPLRYSENTSILNGVMVIYTNFLNLKNIPLLQETYKYVLTDIQNALSVIIPDISIVNAEYYEEVSVSDAEKNIIFYLQCLSDLANASNSIIGMWALQPSILELLAVKMCPHNQILIKTIPALHYSILYLLYSHCKKNSHFISSSDLVSNLQQRPKDMFGLGDVSGTSPTSGHLAIILNILSVILERDVPHETLMLILNWISDIFTQLDKSLAMVSRSNSFLVLITNMLSLGHNFDSNIVMVILQNTKILLNNKAVIWNVIVLKKISVICLLHIDNQDKHLAQICKDILFELPWDITQLELDKQLVRIFISKQISMNVLNNDTKFNVLKEYLTRGSFSPLSNNHFLSVMNCLLQAKPLDTHFLNNIFATSWPLLAFDSDEKNVIFFRHCVFNFLSLCYGWAFSEAAQTCITQKLRTALGKPQETFMKIEGALKGIARDISSTETKYLATREHKLFKVMMSEIRRSGWIIEFMMFLEKYIYNGAEGTATTLPVVSKQVKTFFHTNWPTCRDWLTRVRPAALAVSLYSGNYGAAIYHAGLLLQTAANSTTNIDIEAIAISIAKALIRLQEPEVLHGLYIWIMQKFNRKLHWLKAVAEQANSRHEIAIEYYKKIATALTLQQDNNEAGENPPQDTRITKFLDEQIVQSYKHIHNWEDLQEWKDSQQNNKCQWSPFGVLQTFEDSTEIPEELCNWDVLDNSAIEINKNVCSYQRLFNKVESTLMCSAINMYYDDDDIEKYEKLLRDCNTILDSSFEELSRVNAVHFLKEISVLRLANHGLLSVIANGKLITNPFKPSTAKEHKYDTELENLSKIQWWNQYFTKLNMSEENTFYTECLRLDVIKSARKHANITMARRELSKHFMNNPAFQMYLGNVTDLNELSDAFIMTTNSHNLDIWTLNNATALSELCKLTYEKEDVKTRAINLCASISLGFSQRLAMGEQSYELREKGTRMLLTLSKWVQNETEDVLSGDIDSPLVKFISALPEIGLVDNNISENVIPKSDSAVGKLLQFSVNQCPGLAKAWSNFAAWCFRWGRKMVEYSSKTGEQLTDGDKMQIESVMIGCTPQDFEAVCEILSKTKATCDDEDIDWNEINTSEMIESQLRTVPSLSNAFPEHLALLVDIWRQAQKRVFSYFELSADAYFKFLQLICASDYINHSGEYAVVSATLRLLRLIVKHAMELQTVLESGLANTPTQPWKVIIPQLFSRLNHPETYVRKCVSDLLCRLAEDTPHLITFPAVVGAVENEQNELKELSAGRSYLSNDAESQGQDLFDDDDASSDKVINNELNSCFLDMVETLSSQAPTTILQVKLLVKELQRINLLWDELWLGTLLQHHSDFSKRLIQLESEITKVKNNENLTTEEKEELIKEKHRILFEPIVYALEQLNQVTSVQPETPHEISFQSRFQTLIDDVIDKLRNPPNPEKPQESWAPLKQLQIKLQQKVNKRTSYILRMSDISPVLADLKDTVITMPGVHTNQRAVRVTIRSVENNVAILPTKTRPKKLVFCGSDGKSYTYLFKGLEDLHLDERIMQLLSITNTMMARDSENNDNQTYRARHYSVIPLGPRSGLISWVDNVTPLFALYKRWQNREAAILSAKTNKTVTVPRPSELFYNKLNPLLKEAGIATENRKDWPVSILKQVYKELAAETPNDLLWRELWCGSLTPEQWWQTIRRYSYSVAVMSTIGYIIGLGDRHLDNVLVDLTSGEVVHIDYNVCFEKGKTLRVPEKVPFRMTPNLITALGVTGVEGIFRLACEHVLRTMRRGRETLLTLLEAFVYDPLVEWGGVGGGGGKRRRSHRDARAALAMLAVRTTELRHELTENTEQFQSTLPEFIKCAEKWLSEDEALKSVESRLQNCHQQITLIKEIEAYGPNLSRHPLYDISQKYASYKQAKNAVEDAMKVIVNILKDFDTQIQNYAAANEAINGPQLMNWVQEFSGPYEEEDVPIFEPIKEFLTNAGQSSMLAQCEQAEQELKQAMKQTQNLVRSCLELLSQYAALSQYYPRSRTEYHRIVMFRKLLAAALESKSPEVCREVANQVTALLNAENANTNPAVAQQIVQYNYRLQKLNAEAAANLQKAQERLQREASSEAMAITEEGYRDIKAKISSWVRNEEGASAALECVVIGMLCNLNRRFLMLETGAQSAGDCLVDLTSREGDWFLDDMYALSMQVVELLSLLPLQSASAEDAALPVAVECVRNANLLLADLVQLNFNFSTIILPEALKKVHSEDPSTLIMITELNAVIMNTPIPLNDLLSELELQLRYLVMDMEAPASSSQLIVAEIRARYEALLSATTPEAEVQSAGRMLLMGFNGLFAAVELRSRELADHLSAPIPSSWRKIDHINDALHMSAALQNECFRNILEDIFLIRRIQTIAEVFSLTAHSAHATNGAGGTLLDFNAMCKPVKRFTAEFVSRGVLGVFSRGVATVTCLLLKRAHVDISAHVEQKEIGASWRVPLESLVGVVERRVGAGLRERGTAVAGAVRRGGAHTHTHRTLVRHVAHTQAHSHVARLVLHAHTHIHAQVLGIKKDPLSLIAASARELDVVAEKLAAAVTKTQTLVTQAHQRVKWGAGANPALVGVVGGLEGGWGAVGRVGRGLCSSVRDVRRALGGAGGRGGLGGALTAALDTWEDACTLAQKYSLEVKPVEESLMEMLHPEGNIDQQWVSTVGALLSESVSTLTVERTRGISSVKSADAALKSAGELLLTPIAIRAELINTITPLLTTLSNYYEGPNPLSEYLSIEENISNDLSLVSEMCGLEGRGGAKRLLTLLPHATQLLLTLPNNLCLESNTRKLTRQMATTTFNRNVSGNKPGTSPSAADGGVAGRSGRSAVGAGVWRRVRLKLEGRDPTAGYRASPTDQVEYIIKEATSADNLSMMYEGWMSWV